jgi:hypothetical protein
MSDEEDFDGTPPPQGQVFLIFLKIRNDELSLLPNLKSAIFLFKLVHATLK